MANLQDLAVAAELAARPVVVKGTLAPGIYSNPQVIVDQTGNVISVKGGTQTESSTVVIDSGGTVVTIGGWTHQFGTAGPSSTGVDRTSFLVIFPVAFAGIPKVNCQPTNNPDSYGTAVFSCYPTGISATGFTVNLTCGVTIGGGGPGNLDTPTYVDWMADYA